jgi:hypothetical protein
MKALALALILILNSAAAQSTNSEAMSWDKPIRVINEKDEVRWASDGGTCLTPKAWFTVDEEYKRLQGVEYVHRNEPSPLGWFLAGTLAGVVVASGLLVGLYVATK